MFCFITTQSDFQTFSDVTDDMSWDCVDKEFRCLICIYIYISPPLHLCELFSGWMTTSLDVLAGIYSNCFDLTLQKHNNHNTNKNEIKLRMNSTKYGINKQKLPYNIVILSKSFTPCE